MPTADSARSNWGHALAAAALMLALFFPARATAQPSVVTVLPQEVLSQIDHAVNQSGVNAEWHRRQRRARADVKATLTIAVTAGADGTVETVNVLEAEGIDPDLVERVVAAVRPLTLPAMAMSTARVSYALTYAPPSQRSQIIQSSILVAVVVVAVNLVQALLD